MMNDILICKRFLKMHNFIEGSMETAEFKDVMDDVVKMIDDDMKSKSRVYMWYNYDPRFEEEGDEFHSPLLEPWECTFKIVIYDNKREVFSKIWDGYAYPKSVRQKIDFTNKFVKIINDGQMYSYDKAAYFKTHDGRLSFEMEMLKAQINDKEDILAKVTKMICKVCSIWKADAKDAVKVNQSNNDTYLKDLTTKEKFGDKDYVYPLRLANKKVEDEWAKALEAKTKKYFKNLF